MQTLETIIPYESPRETDKRLSPGTFLLLCGGGLLTALVGISLTPMATVATAGLMDLTSSKENKFNTLDRLKVYGFSAFHEFGKLAAYGYIYREVFN